MPFENYDILKKLIKRDARHTRVADVLVDIYNLSAESLSLHRRVDAQSLVAGKEYFVFQSESRRSRAVNKELFTGDGDPLSLLTSLSHDGVPGMDATQVNRAIYKLTMGFCCACDMRRSGDQQRPGTYFQHVVAHLTARRLNVMPREALPVFSIDDPDGTTTLPTDLIFDLGVDNAKFHVPVKTSTRERIIQVWAHQRVLDGAYGSGRFLGMPVLLAETKTESTKLEVIEICLPEQWRIYQSFIAQMRRIYYLDIPAQYEALGTRYPKIRVKAFGEFFFEAEAVIEEG